MDNDKTKKVGKLSSIWKEEKAYFIKYQTGEKAKINILNGHVFRFFMSPKGDFPDNPTPLDPKHSATIITKTVADYDVEYDGMSHSQLVDNADYKIETNEIRIEISANEGFMSIFDKRTNKYVLREAHTLTYGNNETVQKLRQSIDEYFFGGGMQNGRFSHKGQLINIKNTNEWNDGCVSSPCPFYWSTYGYGILRHTWQQGRYDFGTNSSEVIETAHEGEDFDAFYFINSHPRAILADYYELTGKPIFMPEYAFYEGHLNCFNRDYWVEVSSDISCARPFEDGKYYKCYLPEDVPAYKKRILESLNGDENNYQFSARAMVDRYKKHDIPLGWFIPNDGYGSGYGQTDSLDGDIENLKEFVEYARMNGVEVALWTESQLEPKDSDNPKKEERDLAKEVGKAGVVALKCDVAWVGDGYSFALSAVDHATKIFKNSTKHRPLILMVDGWGGTQRYSGIWSGDQYGGEWEYIRFHIPTYIGTGLSGQPVVGSDMDGIYGGGIKEIQVRDYQWKAFTPLQLNMDGWGDIMKSPFAFDKEATSINRAYLKLKSMLMPYNYSIGHESTFGLPMVRAMFLEFPHETPAYTLDSQYQFMWGPSLLVAPVYIDDSIRDGIFLPGPNQVWIDFFTAEKYQGGKIYNNIKSPLWKIPVFVKDGAVIPMVNPNNNPCEIERDKRIFHIYPNGETSFVVYEDDGNSVDYLKGRSAFTKIEVNGPTSNEIGELLVHIHPTKGNYKDMVTERTTLLRIMTSEDIAHVKAAIKGEHVKLHKADSDKDFDVKENAYYFKKDFIINPYLKEITGAAYHQNFLFIKFEKKDVSKNDIYLKINGYKNRGNIFGNNKKLNKALEVPRIFKALTRSKSIFLHWSQVHEASYYEIEKNGTVYTNIIDTLFTFDNNILGMKHLFRVRSVNDEEISQWSDFHVVQLEDPCKGTVKGVTATCSIASQSGQEINKLTDGDFTTLWHTDWDVPNQADPETGRTFKINFDLGHVFEIYKVEYMPRADAGNGTILKLQYRFSVDANDWSECSDVVSWNEDSETKKILLDGLKMRFFEYEVIESVGGYGSSRQVLFYKKE